MRLTRPEPLTAILLAVIAVLAIAVLGVLLFGGDDDEGGSASGPVDVGEAPSSAPERAVSAAILKWANGGNTAAKCGQLYSTELTNAIYGSRQNCLKQVDDNPAAQINGAKVGDVSIDGDTATAKLSSQSNGANISGTLKMIRQGGTWQIDEFEDGLLRSIVSESQGAFFRAVATGANLPGAAKLVDDVALAECVREELDELPDDQRRSSLLKVLGPGDSSKRIGRIASGCVTKNESGRKLLRLSFESNLRQQLPASGRTCVVGALKKSAPDSLIAQVGGQSLSGEANPAKSKQLEDKLKAAAASCGVKLDQGGGQAQGGQGAQGQDTPR